MTERRVTLEGPVNFRDLGGYPTVDGRTTRWGRIFRSDSTHTLTAADIPVLRELGMRTAIDFRSSQEIERLGIGPLGDVSITHVHCPTFDHSQPISEAPAIVLSSGIDFYSSMIEAGAPSYVAAANSIASDDALPAVFYCLAGKDRTGVFAAILLGFLGVPDDVIVADYALTHEVVPLLTERRIEREGADVEATRWVGIPEELKGAHAFVMEGLIARVHEKWGSWAQYAHAVGFPDETVATLREQLLD
ncbi:MAG TPA: tyrosine-protein phosphatase [Acidimicrobiia bacterium]|nr:tyrosine-protein phosphatase [Acidimicrobiia bacterium]